MTELSEKKPPQTKLEADIKKMAQYVINHIDAGHGLENPAFVTDLRTLLVNVHKLLDAMGPPATLPQQVSYIARVVTEINKALGAANSEALKDLLEQVEAADEKIDAIQPEATQPIAEEVTP